ncbi:MAG: alpha/beta hydrolase [Acidobacteriota bacterium]
MNDKNSDKSGIATINGAQVYYEVMGTGQPLLLVHAGVADSRMWDAQVDAFSKDYQVIRFDLRGFGRSNMPPGPFSNHEDVRGLLDFLQLKPVSVVGISFGGLIALDFALAYPDYVLALILGAPSVSGAAPSERIKRFWEEEEKALDRGDLEGATELNLRLWVDGPHRTPQQVSPVVRDQVQEMQMAIFRKEIPDDVDELALVPAATGRLGEVDIPVQVMIGELDLEEKHMLVDRLVREIAGSQKAVIRGAAHMLNMEQAEVFNRSVLEFLSEI